MKMLVDELIETHGSPDDNEYKWLKPVYDLIATSKDINEAEDRLREMKRFTSSMWGYVNGRKLRKWS